MNSRQLLRDLLAVSSPRREIAALYQNTATELNFALYFYQLDEFLELCDALIENTSVRRVTLKGDMLKTRDAFMLFMEALTRNTSVTHVDAYDCQIDDDKLEALARALSGKPIVRLELANNLITCAGALRLAHALKQQPQLAYVGLANNHISCRGVAALANALRDKRSLQELKLDSNQIHSEGAIALAQLQRDLPTLKPLVLSHNPIGATGLSAIADAQIGNTRISFVGAISGVAGARKVAQLIKENNHISEIDLTDNSLISEGIIELTAALRDNASVTTLCLAENFIDDDSAALIADLLRNNTTLTRLDLSDTQMSDRARITILSALKMNHSLRNLQIDGQPSPRVAATLITLLRTNSTLLAVDWTERFNDRLMKKIDAYLVRNLLLMYFPMRAKQQAPSVVLAAIGKVNLQNDHEGYLNFSDINDLLQTVHKDAHEITVVGDDFAVIRNFWLLMVVRFHLACIDTELDHTTPDHIHTFVLAAINAAAQMDVASQEYASACELIGNYFFHKTALSTHHDHINAFRQSALNFLSRTTIDVLRLNNLRSGLASTSTTAQTIYSPLANVPLNTAVIATGIQKTYQEALPTIQKYQFLNLLRDLVKTPASPTSSSNSTLFSESPLKAAVSELEEFITTEHAQPPSAVHLDQLMQNDAIKQHIERGHLNALAGRKVTTLSGFVEAYTDPAVVTSASVDAKVS